MQALQATTDLSTAAHTKLTQKSSRLGVLSEAELVSIIWVRLVSGHQAVAFSISQNGPPLLLTDGKESVPDKHLRIEVWVFLVSGSCHVPEQVRGLVYHVILAAIHLGNDRPKCPRISGCEASNLKL